MAPTNAGASWDEATKVKFLFKIIEETSGVISGATYAKIAKEWGDPHTQISLKKRFIRMKEANDKVIAAEGKDEVASGSNKRKAANDGDLVDREAKKTKKKSVKVKKEASVEAELQDEA